MKIQHKNQKLTDHVTNICNEQIEVTVYKAGHTYRVDVPGESSVTLSFQDGPVLEDGNGVNGITNEVLHAILIDRMRFLQAGEYPCRENALALTNIEQSLMWLHKRTRDREARGVEGTHQK